MAANPRLREFIKCVLEINELLVEGLQAISENQINTAQARSLVDQARAVLVDHESRISALEAS
jgi:hypothetical protein